MSMESWAENEVRIACEHEAPDRKENEWDYGCACYESALKAYRSLCEDGHSGMSWGFTRSILERLMAHKPLAPIEDTEDIWNLCTHYQNGAAVYQCKRMSSLFKYVYEDGRVEYSDNDYCVCENINNGFRYHGGPASGIIVKELFPIAMPYFPSTKPIVIYTEELLFDKNNGDFDTVGVFYAVKPDGERIDINRYFAESGGGFREIGKEEYYTRKIASCVNGEDV